MHDDPRPRRHNLTAYVCARHFAEMMGPAGARSVGYNALASGSGDHAELARLAEAAIPHLYDGWSYTPPSEPLTSGRITGSGSGPVLAVVQWPVPTMDHALCGYDASQPVGAFIAAANPATVLALIAEVAALRAQSDFYKSDNDVLMKNAWVSRATEAERALSEHRITADLLVSTIKADKAEAERKLAEAVEILRAWLMQSCEDDQVLELQSRSRTFLSKEAERG